MSGDKITPVFVLSLPRSGSTLVQRVVASHSQVSTASEPWFLLPLIYNRRRQGVLTEYEHNLSVNALEDFIRQIPNGSSMYDRAVHDFAMQLYTAAGRGRSHFVDKTPRYFLIAEDLYRIFPEGRFLVVWRNPLAIAASVQTTWGRQGWMVDRYSLDLHRGLDLLWRFVQTPRPHIKQLRYEDLIRKGEDVWKDVCDFLELPYEPGATTRFQGVELQGRLGDHVGTGRYAGLDSEPLERWRALFTNPVRLAWARRYVAWIGEDRLRSMGYEAAELLDVLETQDLSRRGAIADLREIGRIRLGRAVRGRLVRRLGSRI
jgi:hypothetical protein